MFNRIIILSLIMFISSCQTIKIQDSTNESEKSLPSTIFAKEKNIKDIGSIIENIEKDFKYTTIRAKRYGSSVRFYLPHHASFKTDSHAVSNPLKKEIDFIFDKLDSYSYKSFEIWGFADNRGNELYNKQLSHKRAKSVANFIKETRNLQDIETSYKGFGEEIPVAKNDDSYGQLLNRRTEIVVYF